MQSINLVELRGVIDVIKVMDGYTWILLQVPRLSRGLVYKIPIYAFGPGKSGDLWFRPGEEIRVETGQLMRLRPNKILGVRGRLRRADTGSAPINRVYLSGRVGKSIKSRLAGNSRFWRFVLYVRSGYKGDYLNSCWVPCSAVLPQSSPREVLPGHVVYGCGMLQHHERAGKIYVQFFELEDLTGPGEIRKPPTKPVRDSVWSMRRGGNDGKVASEGAQEHGAEGDRG